MVRNLFLAVLLLFLAGCASTQTPTKTMPNDKDVEAPIMQPVFDDFSDVAAKGVCQGYNKDECHAFANRLYDKDDFRTAVYAYDLNCGRNWHIPSCVKLAHMFEKGEGVTQNIGVAYDLYSRICYSGQYNKSCDDMKRLVKQVN